jgi:hypothetical protein
VLTLTANNKNSLYYPKIVLDGNFKLEHMRMKHPEHDVWLSDGHMFMTEQKTYQKHLAMAQETKQVSY